MESEGEIVRKAAMQGLVRAPKSEKEKTKERDGTNSHTFDELLLIVISDTPQSMSGLMVMVSEVLKSKVGDKRKEMDLEERKIEIEAKKVALEELKWAEEVKAREADREERKVLMDVLLRKL